MGGLASFAAARCTAAKEQDSASAQMLQQPSVAGRPVARGHQGSASALLPESLKAASPRPEVAVAWQHHIVAVAADRTGDTRRQHSPLDPLSLDQTGECAQEGFRTRTELFEGPACCN